MSLERAVWNGMVAVALFVGRDVFLPLVTTLVQGSASGLQSVVRTVAPWAIGAGILFLLFLALGEEQFGEMVGSILIIIVMFFVLKGMIQNVIGGGGRPKKKKR